MHCISKKDLCCSSCKVMFQTITSSFSLVRSHESCLACEHFASNQTNHKLSKKLANQKCQHISKHDFVHIISIMYIIISKTFIKIDSLYHLEISRQIYPTYWSKICITTFTVFSHANFSKIIHTIHTSMTSTF